MRSCSEQRSKKRALCRLQYIFKNIAGAVWGAFSGAFWGAKPRPKRCGLGCSWGAVWGCAETPTPPMLTARFGLALAFSGATAEPRENPSHIPPMSPL